MTPDEYLDMKVKNSGSVSLTPHLIKMNIMGAFFKAKALNESRHIVEDFNDVIHHISMTAPTAPLGTPIPTPYFWDNDRCTTSNIQNAIPILYIINDYKNFDVCALATKRALAQNKIIVEINKSITNDQNLLRSFLHHEFVHIREMYSNKKIDPIERNRRNNYVFQNIVYYYDISSKQWDIEWHEGWKSKYIMPNNICDLVHNVLYLLSETEQHARLNQAYYHFQGRHCKDMTIIDMLSEIQDITLFPQFQEVSATLETFLTNGSYKHIMLIGYFLSINKHVSLNMTPFQLVQMFNVIDGRKFQFTQKHNEVISKTMECIEDKMTLFHYKMYDVVLKAKYDFP